MLLYFFIFTEMKQFSKSFVDQQYTNGTNMTRIWNKYLNWSRQIPLFAADNTVHARGGTTGLNFRLVSLAQNLVPEKLCSH